MNTLGGVSWERSMSGWRGAGDTLLDLDTDLYNVVQFVKIC